MPFIFYPSSGSAVQLSLSLECRAYSRLVTRDDWRLFTRRLLPVVVCVPISIRLLFLGWYRNVLRYYEVVHITNSKTPNTVSVLLSLVTLGICRGLWTTRTQRPAGLECWSTLYAQQHNTTRRVRSDSQDFVQAQMLSSSVKSLTEVPAETTRLLPSAYRALAPK
jgi:hypothetical protein